MAVPQSTLATCDGEAPMRPAPGPQDQAVQSAFAGVWAACEMNARGDCDPWLLDRAWADVDRARGARDAARKAGN